MAAAILSRSVTRVPPLAHPHAPPKPLRCGYRPQCLPKPIGPESGDVQPAKDASVPEQSFLESKPPASDPSDLASVMKHDAAAGFMAAQDKDALGSKPSSAETEQSTSGSKPPATPEVFKNNAATGFMAPPGAPQFSW
eukprot:gene16978-23249_t